MIDRVDDTMPAAPGDSPTLHSPTKPPSLVAASGLIVLYFVLQGISGFLAAVAIGIMTGFIHPMSGGGRLGAELRQMLAQPGMQALTVTLTLAIAGLLTLLLTWRKWPALWSHEAPPGFGFSRPKSLLYFALAIGLGLAAPLLGGLLTQFLADGHRVPQDIQQLGTHTPLQWRIPLVLMVAGLGPLVEELLFRGVLLSALLQRWRVGWAIAVSSLLFAMAHLPGLQYQWYALPDLLLLALGLAWLRLRSGSIWPSVLAHSTNNLLAVVAWFVVIKTGS